ncbi:putative RNA-directed DNA polymerase [Senna tora]|uniref:Putative RNA-directed DNA polymerase n=1 Tax=Senna tora TaxID=362788 RepID=A0A834TZG9_9FABA|nr:putative RNA-directed DNA polymerase [Senna tora]
MELKIDDEWVLDYVKIEKMAFQYYKTVYDNESNMAMQDILNKIQHLNIPALNERQSQRLLEPISMSEVEDAIFNIKAFKSPGPDRLPAAFFHKHWEKKVGRIRGLRQDLKEKYKGDWGIEYSNDLGKYLGTFVDGRLNSHSIFEELLEKIQSRLAGWKSKLISQAGRATLISSVLQALPIYQMNNVELPKKVIDKIDSITNNFFWGTKGNGHRIHLLNLNVLRQPRWKGGLGIKNMKLFNKALIDKHIWFLEKYQDPIKELELKRTSQYSLWWKNIVRNKNLVLDNLRWAVGNGEYVRINSKFWPFKERNNDQDMLLADLITQVDGRRWDINALQRIYNRHNVYEIIKILLPHHKNPDILAWKINKEGK